jgi:hypothetical protein
MDIIALLASLMGIAFVTGLRLYATVFALGLGMKVGFVHVDPAISGLDILAHPLIIAVAGGLYVIEFVGDKVPWVDSVLDMAHTLIRPIGAAILAAVALGEVDPVVRFAAVLVCGSVSLTSHVAKAGIRLTINHSPEPLTNIGMSFIEDGLALVMLWLAVAHPYVMLTIVALFLGTLSWLMPRIFRLATAGLKALYRQLKGLIIARGFLSRGI